MDTKNYTRPTHLTLGLIVMAGVGLLSIGTPTAAMAGTENANIANLLDHETPRRGDRLPMLAQAQPLGIATTGAASRFSSTPEQVDDWDIISREKSLMSFQCPCPFADVVRRQTTTELFFLERWDWETGALTFSKINNIMSDAAVRDLLPGPCVSCGSPYGFLNRYRNDASGLLTELETWDYLQEIDLQISGGDIDRRGNRVGTYFLAVSNRNNIDKICIFFRQGIGIQTAGSSPRAFGEMSGYDCRGKDDISESDLRAKYMEFFKSITEYQGDS